MYQPVTQIKKNVDNAHQNNYLQTKQKRQLKYYSLYMPQITKIQRWFRRCLVKKTKYLEAQIQSQLVVYRKLEASEEMVDHRIKHMKMKQLQMNNIDIDEVLEGNKENMDGNIRKMLRNVVDNADEYVLNSAMAKVYMHELTDLQKEEEKLSAEIQQLHFEKERRNQRRQDWEQKLSEIRDRIFIENSSKKQLEEQLLNMNHTSDSIL